MAKTGKSDERADFVPVLVPRLAPEEVGGATLVGYKRVKHEYSDYCVLLIAYLFITFLGILLQILTVNTHRVGKAEVLQHAESLTETNGQKHI